ncbi:MAG: hypothetical protein WA960_14845 [Tunicatimonas sp.]
MSRILTLSANDFRMVFRDPMLRIFLFMPLLVLALVIWVVPLLFAAYPAARDYDYVILMLAGMQTSTMFGFINGFVFLEEKDEQVFSALRVLPVSAGMLVGVRMLLGFAIAALVNVALLRLTPWVEVGWGQTLLLATQYALLAPLLALLVATFAQNKVEGLAQFKLYNFMLNLPALIYFLPNSFLHALAVIPTYWTFRSVEALHGGGDFWFFFGGGTLVYGGALVGLVWLFEKRVF